MVCVLDSGSKGLGSRPGCINVLCSLAKYSSLREPPPTQLYKWVPVNWPGSLIKYTWE